MGQYLSYGQRIGMSIVSAVLAFAAAFSPGATPHHANAQSGTPSPLDQRIVGAWRLTFESPQGPSQSLLTLMADGAVLFSGQAVKPASKGAPVTFISAAHGVWQQTGSTTAELTWIGMVADGQGNLLAIVTDNVTATLEPDGDSWGGAYRALVADPEGNVLFEGDGTVTATRIALQTQNAPEATPVIG